jgi:hypothetical protein
MPSADQAIAFSRLLLRPGGLFVMDDYVGPTRFQVSEPVYQAAQEIRSRLPEKYLANNTESKDRYPLLPNCPRITTQRMIETDPSEMADSESILPAIQKHMPEAQIVRTGGLVYILALRPLFGNFDENDPADTELLSQLLEEDRNYALDHPHHTFHAFAWWQKRMSN